MSPVQLFDGGSAPAVAAAEPPPGAVTVLPCPRPGCTAPGYLSEVHHVDEWAGHHRTDIDTLTFACGPDHRLLEEEGWTTRKNADGITEWIPPPHLDFGKPRTNGYWHPDRYFRMESEEDDH